MMTDSHTQLTELSWLQLSYERVVKETLKKVEDDAESK